MDTESRSVVTQHDVRGALFTASVSLTTGTGATFVPGDADYFNDLIEVSFANQSTGAVGITLTSDGTAIRTVQLPASTTIQLDFEAALKQGVKNTPILAKMDDVTATTVVVEGTFIKKKN